MSYEIEVDGLAITVEKKKMKNIRIRVLSPTGQVKISAPHRISREEIIKFASSEIEWIKEKQSQILKRQLKYENGETHYLWGNPYTLQLIERNKHFKDVFVEDDIMYLPVNLKKPSLEERRKTMIEFYRHEIKSAIPDVLEKSVAVVGREPDEWRVKNMKTRWGTCNTREKRIWINLQLAKKSPQCLDYVMIHELTHLIVPNHGREFKAHMDRFYPNWREVRKLLNQQAHY